MSKIDEKDKIYLKELCGLENLVYTQTVYTPENGQFSTKMNTVSSKQIGHVNLFRITKILFN
jgi:hypothetical protein